MAGKPATQPESPFAVEWLPIADLKPHPRNPNRHPAVNLETLRARVKRHGPYKNAVVADDLTILAGHGIIEAARLEGWPSWPCERRPYGPEHPDALDILVGDNESADASNPGGPERDTALLAQLLREQNEREGLAGTGYDEARLAELLAETEVPNFEPVSEDEQGRLDELAPIMVACPECGHEFNAREAGTTA